MTDLIFRWLSKPFRGEYLSANKQFIAPLPIPDASPADCHRLAQIAEQLQAGYTRREQLLGAVKDRLGRLGQRAQRCEWLLPGVRSIAQIDAIPRPRMIVADRRALSNRLYKEEMEAALARADELIHLDSSFEAVFRDGELCFLVDGADLARGVYADVPTGELLLAQWQSIALQFQPTGKDDAKRLIDRLRNVAFDAPAELTSQIVDRQQQLSALSASLSALEGELHALTCDLYQLSPAERQLVEGRIG